MSMCDSCRGMGSSTILVTFGIDRKECYRPFGSGLMAGLSDPVAFATGSLLPALRVFQGECHVTPRTQRLEKSMRPRGLEPPRPETGTRSLVWRVCQFRHGRK